MSALSRGNYPRSKSKAFLIAVTWGDVVFFYGEYDKNASLFELGQAVSGAVYINMMQGTIKILIIE